MHAGGEYWVEADNGNVSVSVSLFFECKSEVQYFRLPPNGDRIERANDTGTTYYLYDREDVIAILNETGAPVKEFLHGIGIDEPVAMKIGANIYYYAQDGLGSTVALINAADGNVVAAYRYDAWGTLQNYTGTIATKNPYLFTGREYDWQTGIYYYRARSYDANLGRFLQRDPNGMVDGTNMYVYVGNDPMNRVDPSGKGCGWNWGCINCMFWCGLASVVGIGIIGGILAAAVGGGVLGAITAGIVALMLAPTLYLACCNKCGAIPSIPGGVLPIISAALALTCAVVGTISIIARLVCIVSVGVFFSLIRILLGI
ncbi:MAG: RHS repeat-associated core domain-containing protein [Euryarchaeota archaeon]|nr:RHS repeat-associated core domain-containing protein [Euryarchaeota archaeon]